jgi:cell division protein FtsL
MNEKNVTRQINVAKLMKSEALLCTKLALYLSMLVFISAVNEVTINHNYCCVII